MLRKLFIAGLASFFVSGAVAQESVKIGLILPLTGPFAPIGKQIEAGARLYMQEQGATVAGRKLELIVKDDAGVADTTKRLAQEMVVNDKVGILAGFGLTPLALATAPIATQAKVPQIVMSTGTSIVTERSPFIVRTAFTLPQKTMVLADWAAKNNIKKVVTIVADYAPGHDAETSFKLHFGKHGGQVPLELRVPVANPDYAPFLQRTRDAAPDAVFVFVPAGLGGIFMKQFVERGLDKSGIKLIATGDLTDDDILNKFGDVALGLFTSGHYSAAHPSAKNKAYVAAFRKANNNLRPNFMSVGGYDGMHVIYEALKKTGGKTDGEALVNAMKGLKWESPRGPSQIDPETRDIIHNIYMRKVEKVDGELYNIEFATFEAVKDPVKAAKK